jgi:2-polyprenyl-3-methyl-5-hydroxy-6-metoxy-1,4-benzoquinol methylase
MKKVIERFQSFVEREKLNNPGNSPIIAMVFQNIRKKVIIRYRNYLVTLRKDSTFINEEDMFMCALFPKKVLDLIVEINSPTSVLDVGCGQGLSLKYFLSCGIDALGIENSQMAIEYSGISDKIIKSNLNFDIDLKRRFDLVWCFEVIEHIHPKYEKTILKTLTRHGDIIILSAAKPGQGGHGHFNEQLPEYWIDKFANLGYDCDFDFSQKLKGLGETHCENLLCFKRTN